MVQNIQNTNEVLDLHTNLGIIFSTNMIWTSLVQPKVNKKYHKHVRNGGKISYFIWFSKRGRMFIFQEDACSSSKRMHVHLPTKDIKLKWCINWCTITSQQKFKMTNVKLESLS